MAAIAFKQVDVFTQKAFLGNPVAVILDGRSLTPNQMQQIARWTNLSETTFVFPAESEAADYQVRIFTPEQELPFAGHPSIGTAFALVQAGLVQPKNGLLKMQCKAGILQLRLDQSKKIFVRVPKPQLRNFVDVDLAKLSDALGCSLVNATKPAWTNVGPTWLVVDLDHAAVVRALKPDHKKLGPILRDQAVGITVFGRERDGECVLAVRSFCPNDGIIEDPVCGSGNASVAAYLSHHDHFGFGKLPSSYCASQGREVGRDGYVFVNVAKNNEIEIGGDCITCIDGKIELELLAH